VVKHPLALVAGLLFLLASSPASNELASAKSTEAQPIPKPPQTREPLPHAAQHGSTIVADSDGAWVIERSVGTLIRVDREGRPHAFLDLSPGLGELIRDDASGVLFVADRAADRVVRVRPGAGDAMPTIEHEFALRDPHGLALTPDGTTLLVTSVADRELVALASDELELRWRIELGAEPRPVAIAPDGRTATVGFVSLPALAEVDVADGRHRWHSLEPRSEHVLYDHYAQSDWKRGGREQHWSHSRYQVATQINRERVSNVFVLGYTRDDVVVPHQLATPQLTLGAGTFGHALTYLSRAESRELGVHQPRSLVYDSAREVLYIGGYGDDGIVAMHDSIGSWRGHLHAGCGVDGLAIDPSGNVWAHCALSRKVVRIDVTVAPHAEHVIPTPAPLERWLVGPELVASGTTPELEHGAELFRRGERAKPACSSCHPEARSDGQTWRYGDALIQAPILAGRMSDAHPQGWQRGDADVQAAIKRGAKLLGTPKLTAADLRSLQAYLVSLPTPQPPTSDARVIERGRAHFIELGCQGCHSDPQFASISAPALIGLAHSAPYLHDGSAIDLRTLLTGRGSVPHTDQSAALPADALAELIAFLESL
jgi:sugar lactone lactonase YvrE